MEDLKAIVASLKSLKASELGAKRSALVEAKKAMVYAAAFFSAGCGTLIIVFLASTNADLLAPSSDAFSDFRLATMAFKSSIYF